MEGGRLALDVCEIVNSQEEISGNSDAVDSTNENTETGMTEKSDMVEKEIGRKRKSQNEKPTKARKLVFSEEDLDKRRHTANFQERSRMKKMSEALDRLRSVLPDDYKIHNRKMSKIRTIKVAVNYIKALGDMIKNHDIMISTGRNAGITFEHFQTPSMPDTPYSLPYLGSQFVPLQYPDTNMRVNNLQADQLSTNYYSSLSSTPRQVPQPFQHPYYQTPPQTVPDNTFDATPCFNTPGFAPTPVNRRYRYTSPYPNSLGLSVMKKYRSSTISTPIAEEGRNVNELNASFLNSTGDDIHEACLKRRNPTNKYCVEMDGIYPLPEEDESAMLHVNH